MTTHRRRNNGGKWVAMIPITIAVASHSIRRTPKGINYVNDTTLFSGKQYTYTWMLRNFFPHSPREAIASSLARQFIYSSWPQLELAFSFGPDSGYLQASISIASRLDSSRQLGNCKGSLAAQ